MKPIKLRTVGYLDFKTRIVHKTKESLKKAQHFANIVKDKIILAHIIRLTTLEMKLQQALENAKKLKGFFKYSTVMVAKRAIAQFYILKPKYVLV